jgi:3'-phosphoadenosine 5'-phosphosulfate sulfotransferase (PAPS reductase)/FAD synthetase
MNDPFRIEGPAVISFSGGRTSGYMLWRILQSHGGKLPDDVRVMFANTGKEMPETLDFVQECSERWNVPITWVEYRQDKQFAIVDYKTASRNGEPFAQIITDRNFLPNPVARICTVEMKVLTMCRAVTQAIGWEHFTNCVGLRADEQRRVAKLNDSNRKEFDRVAPLATAGVIVSDVGKFWKENEFDLRLPNMNGKTMHGNCDLCFLKGGKQIQSLINENPSRAIWWAEQESRIHSAGQIKGDAGRFRSDRPSYRSMYENAINQGQMFSFDDEPLQDCACTD